MSYLPESPPSSSEDLVTYLWQELSRVSAAINEGYAAKFETLYVAPAKPRDGMVCIADGVYWNPGAGQGVYSYFSSAWHKLS